MNYVTNNVIPQFSSKLNLSKQRTALENYMQEIVNKNAPNINNCTNKTIKLRKRNDAAKEPVKEPVKEQAKEDEGKDAAKEPVQKQEELTIHNYTTFNFKANTVANLKLIAKNCEIKTSGKKDELMLRICAHFYFSASIVKIQKIFRGNMVRLFLRNMRGPAGVDRSVCVNHVDFLSMEEIASIPINQFFSYKDVDGFVYGFDTVSFHNLIIKTEGQLCNPYNRALVPSKILKSFKQLIKVGNILNMRVNVEIEDTSSNLTSQKTLELRILDLFQQMNSLGNYSEPQWFNSLDKVKLIKFMRELFDIWNYRLQITIQTKIAICPPIGNPFRFSLNISELIATQNIDTVRNSILNVLELFVNGGIDRDSRCLGSYYVLGALTLVNDSAAASLPWLHQSMA